MVSHFNKISIWLSVEFQLLVSFFLQSKTIYSFNKHFIFYPHRLLFKECFLFILPMRLDKHLPVVEKKRKEKKRLVYKTKTKAKTKNPKGVHACPNQSFSIVLSPRSLAFSTYAYEYAAIHYYRNHKFSKIFLPKDLGQIFSRGLWKYIRISKKIWNDLGLGKLLMTPFWLNVHILYDKSQPPFPGIINFWRLFWRINELCILKI